MKKKCSLEAANRDAYFTTHRPHGPLGCHVGDVVGYSRYFLLSCGIPATSDTWRLTGTIVTVDPPFAVVHWKDEDEPQRVRLEHLAFVGANLRWAE